MCLMINDKTKPPCAKSRKFVYKIVRKRNGQYLNLFTTSATHIFNLGELTVSDRHEHYICEENYVSFGFHAVHSEKVAKNLINHIVDSMCRWSIDFNGNLTETRHWRGCQFAILKCAVTFDDHIADGTFEIPTVYYCESSVYNKLTPVEEIFVCEHEIVDMVNAELNKEEYKGINYEK